MFGIGNWPMSFARRFQPFSRLFTGKVPALRKNTDESKNCFSLNFAIYSFG